MSRGRSKLIVKIVSKILFVLLLLLAGCERAQLAEDLRQDEAHEIIKTLSQAGIQSDSSKGKGAASGYAVSVSKSDYLASIDVLSKSGLPRQREKGFTELVEPQGLIPNSRELEALRIDHALAREIEEALKNKAGVYNVKAVVRYHFGVNPEQATKPNVAIVIRQQAGAAISTNSLRSLVQSFVPGVLPSDINIDLSEIESKSESLARYGIKSSESGMIAVPLVPFLFWHIPGDEQRALALTTLGLIAAAMLLGLLLGYYYAFYSRFRRVQAAEKKSLRIAGSLDEFSVKNLPGR